eukprot:Skav205698  [mRNA]  locus=scaffold3495:117389:117772:- [translate_table: standard]
MAADDVGHLEDLVSADLWPIVRSAHGDFEPLRQQFGPENCKIKWASSQAFIFSLQRPGPRQNPKPKQLEDSTCVVVAGARIFSVMSLSFAPDKQRHSIDDLIFESAFDEKDGVVQWRVVHIGEALSE